MKRDRTILTLCVAFFIVILLSLAGCDNGGSSKGEYLLTPGKNTTIKIGEATVFFPGDSIKKEVICYVTIEYNSDSLPEDFNEITDIYSLRLSEPDAYEPDNEGNISFSVSNPIDYAVYASFEKYESTTSNDWYHIGGAVGDDTIEAPIPMGVCKFVVGGFGQETSDAHMRKGPYLILNGSPDSMTVQWQVSSTSEESATLFWGPVYYDNPNSYPNQIVVISDSDRFFSKQISSGLTAGERTYYCVTIIDTDSGDHWNYHGSFLTPPNDDATTVTFYAYGDTRSYPADHNRVLHYMNADSIANGLKDVRQTFLIHAGDFCSRGLEAAKWDSEFFYYRKHVSTNEVLATFPIMGVVGNHEHLKKGAIYEPPAKYYHYFWNYPMYQTEENSYYSFDYGPVHFVSLDVYTADFIDDTPNDDTDDTPQITWLKADLDASTKPWKIVMFHHPAYTSKTPGADKGFAVTEDIQNNLVPLIELKGVDLVIQAHEHFYSRSIHNGLNYLMLGGGGAGLVSPYSSDSNDPMLKWLKVAKKEYHFARIKVDSDSLQVTVLNANDTSFLDQIDYVEITK